MRELKINQVRLYWIIVFLSIIFTVLIWHILEDINIRGILLLLSTIIGCGTAIFFDILFEIRKVKILRPWSEMIITLWVGLPIGYSLVIGYHDFPILIIWIIMLGIGIFFIINNGAKIKASTRI